MNSERLLQTFLELVAIPSESYYEKPITEYLVAKLSELGLEIYVDEAGKKIGSNTGNLVGRLRGNRPGIIAFSAHQDTVVPGVGIKPHIEDGVIKSDGTTILAADDKSGIAAMLEMLRVFKDKPHPTIEVIFDICEEVGLLGAAALDLNKIESKMAVILDVDGEPGKITIAAPFQDVIKVTIKGKASHAGIAPEKGISAIQIASKAISQMRLGLIDEETTANIGIIQGGKATNIVPDECKINMEARSRNEQKLINQTRHMLQCFIDEAQKVDAGFEFDVKRMFKGYDLSPANPLPTLASNAAKEIGVQPKFTKTAGGSVSNIFNAKGLPSIVISTGMSNPHSVDEFIKITDLETTARWIIKMVEMVGGV